MFLKFFLSFIFTIVCLAFINKLFQSFENFVGKDIADILFKRKIVNMYDFNQIISENKKAINRLMVQAYGLILVLLVDFYILFLVI